MSGHNVAIAYLPEGCHGVGAAATVATHMKRTFPSIQLRLLVGIGGGVPNKQDVRLGDVVVGMPAETHGAVVQYDLGKNTTSGFSRKGYLLPPPQQWIHVVSQMRSNHRLTKQNKITIYLSDMLRRYPDLTEYQRPPPQSDVLYTQDNLHVFGEETCLKCDQTRVIQRSPERHEPTIFYGLIASGNQVMKNAVQRDEISRDAGCALCFEMEAAGVVNDFPSLVVRGISDYADSHKNDDWHAYAAAAAAGCAKELLSYVGPHVAETCNELMRPDDHDRQHDGQKSRVSSAITDSSFDRTNDSEIRSICEWFSPLNFWNQQQDVFDRYHDGTGTWFLQDQIFLDWLNGTMKVLWCPGIPGSGKTVISSVVVDLLRKRRSQDKTIGVTCIYLQYKEKHSITTLISNLIKQLLQQCRFLPEPIRSVFVGHQDHGTRPGRKECFEVLNRLLNEFSKVFLVIDGLDEASEDITTNFIKPVLDMLALHVVVFSRYLPYIERLFLESPRLDIWANSEDLERYFEGRVQENADFATLINEANLHQGILTAIIRKSHGMFLLAHLHIGSIIKLDNPQAVERALSSLPSQLYDSYDKILERIMAQPEHDRARAEQVIMWITAALRPLTLDELLQALAVSINSNEFSMQARPTVTRLVSVCAGLVTFDKQSQKIRPAHETIQAYFEERLSVLFPNAQRKMATACLVYLASAVPRIQFCTTDGDLRHLLAQNAFLDYAARYWGQHSHDCGETNPKELALQVLQDSSIISCITQIMFVPDLHFPGYSQQVPTRVSAAHLFAFFNLEHTLGLFLDRGGCPDEKDSDGMSPLSWAAAQGNVAVAKTLIRNPDVDVNSQDDQGQTPLSRASEEGQDAVVKLLLDCNRADINSRDTRDMTPLAWAVSRQHVTTTKLLLGAITSPNTVDDEGQSVLSTAIESRNENIILQLLVAGADVDVGHTTLCETLLWGAHQGHWQLVKTLLEKSSMTSKPSDILPRGLLDKAAEDGQEDVVHMLVESGTDDRHWNLQRSTALWLAAENGYRSIMQILIKAGADVEAKNESGRTLLQEALENQDKVMVEFLVRNGANIDAANDRGETLLESTVKRNDRDMVKLLANQGVNVRENMALHWAVENRKIEMVRLLLQLGARINRKDNSGKTALHLSVEYGLEDIICLLAEKEANLDAYDSCRRTALWYAVRQRDWSTVRLLRRLGAEIDPCDAPEGTPLQWAVEIGDQEMVAVLVEEGANIKQQNSSGQSPLRLAVERDRYQIVRYLLMNGADINDQDSAGLTALAWAVEHSLFEMVQFLASKGADIELKMKNGLKPLTLAATSGSYNMVRFFMKEGSRFDPPETEISSPEKWLSQAIYGAVISGENWKLRRLLEARLETENYQLHDSLLAAAERHKFEVVMKLLQDGERFAIDEIEGLIILDSAGAKGKLELVDMLLKTSQIDLNGRVPNSNQGFTPLLDAAWFGQFAVVDRFLKEQDIDRDIQTLPGNAVIHIAASRGHLEVLNVLLEEHSVLANSRTSYGWTALHLAAQYGHLAIVKRLLQENGVTPNDLTNDGRTAVRVAEDYGSWSVAGYLNTLLTRGPR
ncbi:uncharacterized protein A1O9_10929 [Exophiala aquamarina CBS 119918]|uniref:Uncharacterized protein n=1 Tax=Exophiala aquamarina CBS 119918 TaxID=1182545 RepID=A0A072NZG7_9EURO|nr:uncharacterized protein A1O9_10929 [Exophiala aquamarina CBS 119918]KEF53021.1 hypothetical protein A1O9_10929 [Exophiala aquamarina CBS 119918]